VHVINSIYRALQVAEQKELFVQKSVTETI